VLARLVVCCCA